MRLIHYRFLSYCALFWVQLFILCNPNWVFSQDAVNPFDIGTPLLIVADSTKVGQAGAVSDNPFDIIRNPMNPTSPVPLPKITDATKTERPQQFIFILVFSVLLLLTVLVTASRSLISRIYQAFVSDVVLRALFRERSSLTSAVYLSLYLMFIINIGVFSYLFLRSRNVLLGSSDWLTLLYCILGLGALIVIKHIILWILSYVYPVAKELAMYNFIILIFGISIGLILAPINVFLPYLESPFAGYLMTCSGGMLLVLYGFMALRSLFLIRSYIFPYFFHFMLYLCSVEVIPVLIIFKIINSKLQIPIL